ncbi:hypothetical protein TcCL_NonESM10623 [Trypanosoma cruzi]|nr:hypothetical protein TcCL_NonESM10623 [Trypanosoma cruzi]
MWMQSTATYVCTVIRFVMKRDGAVNDLPGGDASWNGELTRLAPCVFPSYMRAHAQNAQNITVPTEDPLLFPAGIRLPLSSVDIKKGETPGGGPLRFFLILCAAHRVQHD